MINETSELIDGKFITNLMIWFVYIAEFKHGLYTGITLDVNRRVKQHNSGAGAKSLKGKGPITLVYTEQYQSHIEAAKREREVKGWNRKKKLQLIVNQVKGSP